LVLKTIDLVTWPENGATLASLDDLACMKLSAITQPGSRKDFYNVHTLITRSRSLFRLQHDHYSPN
jgi:hypothetical protein